MSRRNIKSNNSFKDYSRYSKNSRYTHSSNRVSESFSRNNIDRPYRSNKKTLYNSNSNLDKQNPSKISSSRYSHKKISNNNRDRRKKSILCTLILTFVLIGAGFLAYRFWPIHVKINGKEYQLVQDKSLKYLIETSNISVNPGNLVAVDYSLLKKGEGDKYFVSVNGNEEKNLDYFLHNGDDVKYENGHDIMEEYKSIDSDIKASAKAVGTGSIHEIEGSGEAGKWSVLTGKISGITCERQTKEPDNITCNYYNVNTGDDKVIAFTFDDGPSDEYTQEILDLLNKYDAHATFFTIGENTEEEWGKKLVRKEEEAGHLVCSHTYDHARASGGVDVTLLNAEEQIQEITKGQSVLSSALGHKCSNIMRLPGGNLNETTIRLMSPYVSAEIGWNVDTGDWSCPGKNKILNAMKQASSGDIILCHDGGGDRSQTVAALKEALPYLKEKGYSFVTVEELMNYPKAENNKSKK